MIGTTIGGKYAIVRRLGEGGMGAVYEARHTGTGRRVAVKVITGGLSADPQLLARFEIEARAAGAIESEHIAQVLDVGRDEAVGAPYLVMEFLVGEDLQHLFERLGPITPELALRIGVQACLGLEKAHAEGVIHRDIKPANLFLTERDGGELRVKLVDFGIAKVTAAALQAESRGPITRVGTFLGSPLYMSPEQTRGSGGVDARTDVWSLGIVLYPALAGGTPFDEASTLGEFVARVCTTRVAPIGSHAPWVDPAIGAAVERALAIDPAQRYQTAAEMRAALEAFLPQGASIRAAMLRSARPGSTAIGQGELRARATEETPLYARPTEATPPPVAQITDPQAQGGSMQGGSMRDATAEMAPLFPNLATPPIPMTPPPAGVAHPLLPAGATVPGTPVAIPSQPPIHAPSAMAPNAMAPNAPAPPPTKRDRPSLGLAVVVGLGFAALGGLLAAWGLGAFDGRSQADPIPSASASAPPVDGAAPLALVGALAGSWWSEAGVGYDAVMNGELLEFRIRDGEPLAAQGYVAGDTHFSLRAVAGEGSAFRVAARIRPLPPKGTSYDRNKARPTCENTWRQVDKKPLRAEREGDRLVVHLVRADPPASTFVREGSRVTGCVGLADAPVTEIEINLSQTPTASAITTATRWTPIDAGVKHDAGSTQDAGSTHDGGASHDAGSPQDAGAAHDAGQPAPDAGDPSPPGSIGASCRFAAQCQSRNCVRNRCQSNEPGSPCVGALGCRSRRCVGGICR